MIITRAPLRISFLGGGTDLPAFYLQKPGRVISTAIDKYAYVSVHLQPLSKFVSVRYRETEFVDHPSQLKNDRLREALLHLGITSHVDIATFSDLPVKTGLGSSSSFSVALMKALTLFRGTEADRGEIAELASHLEINLVKEPVGKQDQYAAAFGGINIFQFNPDHSVDVSPVLVPHEKRLGLEQHLQMFYTGVSRNASSVLAEQRANTANKMDTLQKMSDAVFDFKDRLVAGDFCGMGGMLHDGWLLKKTLASNLSNNVIDNIYQAGMNAGAWGGKLLGAGGGGCLLFMSPAEKKPAVREAVIAAAKKNNLEDFAEIPFHFAPHGLEVLLNNGGGDRTSFA